MISQIGSVSNLVTTGSVNFDDGTFILDNVNDRVGIDITPSQYKLEVGGDIYFTGSQLIGGDSSAFVLQRRLDATPIRFNKFLICNVSKINQPKIIWKFYIFSIIKVDKFLINFF